MKIATKYIADDGVEFLTREECLSHEDKVEQIIAGVPTKGDPSICMLAMISAIKFVLKLDIPSYDGYVGLFSSRKPCSFHCTLWRFFADYSNKYPTVYRLFSDTLDRYVEMYGEPEKHD